MFKHILLLSFSIFFAGCKMFEQADVQLQKMDPHVNYERDMIVCVNGVCKEGSITMPLLDKNEIHVYARGDLNTFLTTACGGKFKQKDAGNVKVKTKSFWGTKEITKKNEAIFTIEKSDFHETGICPLYLSGIANSGRNSDAFINWQTDQYKLSGYMVCQMQKRAFEGVEACDTGAESLTKVVFDEDVILKPDPGCEIGKNEGSVFEWQVKSGECHFAFLGKKSNVRGVYTTYGFDEITVR